MKVCTLLSLTADRDDRELVEALTQWINTAHEGGYFTTERAIKQKIAELVGDALEQSDLPVEE